MEVSQGTSVSSTANHEDNARSHNAEHTLLALGGNGEAATQMKETERTDKDDFGGATLTAHQRKDTKALYSKEAPSLDTQKGVVESSQGDRSVFNKLRSRCSENINHEDATIPLAWQALLTGLVDALLYTRGTIWTGFQTGNMVQFSENIAQYMFPHQEKNPLLTLLRALSVSSFFLGSLIGARLGARYGDKKRGWIVLSSVIQSIFLVGASAILLSRPANEAPSFQYWPGVVVMTAFSMGMQSIAAQKLVSPAFATTVAFTASLTQVASDPYLFALTLAPIEEYRHSRSHRNDTIEEVALEKNKVDKPKPPKTLGRDRRVLALIALCTGGGVAQCLLFSRADLRGGLTIAAGFKMIQALLWFTIPCGQKQA